LANASASKPSDEIVTTRTPANVRNVRGAQTATATRTHICKSCHRPRELGLFGGFLNRWGVDRCLPSGRFVVTPKRFVYVLKNADPVPRYYTGLTADLAARLQWHNAGPARTPRSFGRGWLRSSMPIACDVSGFPHRFVRPEAWPGFSSCSFVSWPVASFSRTTDGVDMMNACWHDEARLESHPPLDRAAVSEWIRREAANVRRQMRQRLRREIGCYAPTVAVLALTWFGGTSAGMLFSALFAAAFAAMLSALWHSSGGSTAPPSTAACGTC
jgi:hypothetical protein